MPSRAKVDSTEIVVIAAGRRLTTTGSALAAIAAALLYFAPVPAEAACGRNGVTLYQTYWCPYCRQVRQLFARHGVRFRIVEISNNPSAQALMIKKFGSTGVPWTVIDGVAVPGYDAPRLKQLLCVK